MKFLVSCVLCLCVTAGMFAPSSSHASDQSSAPSLSYRASPHNSRQLIFMNNPEFLWFTRDACDLADDFADWRNIDCQRSLFHITALRSGHYRAWWEHRNMMPFSIRSGILVSNHSSSVATVVFQGDAIEPNSQRRGGNEFVSLLNSPQQNVTIQLNPGERRFLSTTQNTSIKSGRFFAGVLDFTVAAGEVSIEEVVFKNSPAEKLQPVGYSDRTLFKIHESLVYKGISEVSAVTLQGATFSIDDNTTSGARPVSYAFSDVVPLNTADSSCRADRLPACSGSAVQRQTEAQQSTTWVTHIAPDPNDPNPKRKRAITGDLISLVLPGSKLACASEWPQPALPCMQMSHHYFWFLNDFQSWRLPNWGNWAVHYMHPITVINRGSKRRMVAITLSSDGASPIAFKGDGVSTRWKQVFLDRPRTAPSPSSSLEIARGVVEPHGELLLSSEFILSGPGAGTLEHSVQISDAE